MNPGSLARAILSLGGDDFPQCLLAHLVDATPVDHLAIFRFNEWFVPELIGTASTTPSNIAREAGKVYQRQRYYRHDPGARQIASQHPHNGPLLFRLHERDILDRAYRERIYVRYKLLERISIIDRVEDTWLAVNLYRSTRKGPFTPPDLDNLRAVASSITALAGKHAQLRGPGAPGRRAEGSIEDVYARLLGDGLSARERAACAGALRGLSVKRIAVELGVKPSTVATLRNRAFQKLGISSTTELFVRCIGILASDQPE